MKLYAIEVTVANLEIINLYSDAEPLHVQRYLDMDEPYYMIANYDGCFRAICWIEAEGFAREFSLATDLIPGKFTEVTEL